MEKTAGAGAEAAEKTATSAETAGALCVEAKKKAGWSVFWRG